MFYLYLLFLANALTPAQSEYSLEEEEEDLYLDEEIDEEFAEDELEMEEDEMDIEDEDDFVEEEKRKYKPDELPEGGTDPSIVLNHPVAIQAKKMSKLLMRQDVVATCRFILFKSFKSFYAAKDHCESIEWPFTHRGMGIATVYNEEENTEIRHLLQIGYGLTRLGGPYERDNWAWVGLVKQQNNETKLSKDKRGKFVADDWRWADGNIKPKFWQFARKMPDQKCVKKKGCQSWVMINKRGYWDDTFHYFEAPFVCNYCGKYVVVAKHVSWDKAKTLCESYGLKMAIVNSKEDNIELGWAANITFNYAPTEPKRWNSNNWIWLGTEEIMDDSGIGTGKWRHHDGSTLDYEPRWDYKRQPDNWVKKRGEQQVVAFSRINRKWDDSFRWKKRPFACMCPHRGCKFTTPEQSSNSK